MIGVSDEKATQNFMININKIAESTAFQRNLNYTTLGKFDSKKESKTLSSSNPFDINKKDSEYRYIPNNFKTQEGVAFAATMTNINIQSGLTGIYNMGNTCFINTGNILYKI